MQTLRPSLCLALGLSLFAIPGCDKDKASNDPEAGSNLLGPTASASSDDDLGSLDDDEGLFDDEGGDDMFGDEEVGEEGEGDEAVAKADKKKLPPRGKQVERCKKVREKGSKKKKKVCKMVDSKPKVSASYGVVALLGDFRWGMTPKQVFKVLSKDVEDEYAKRQKSAKNAVDQDNNRKWRSEQLQRIKENHTKFTKASKHRWGVSLIQYEYEDDNQEEMLWASTGKGLRKFYFFKDGELWKIFYAYSTDVWPGKTYDDIVKEKFMKWFGPSPELKTKEDPKTKQPLLTYYEWTAMDDEKIRSFDMTSVHGVIGLAVVDGRAEARIGERLPNQPKETGYVDAVNDVLGGSDVCYNESGDITECSEKEAMGFEE
jgi:hypothetical protein